MAQMNYLTQCTFDFGALCYRFEPLEPKGKPVFAWRCWLPQETLEQRVKNEQVPYDRWRNEGAIEEVPGATFQNSYAIKAVREACARDQAPTHVSVQRWCGSEAGSADHSGATRSAGS